MSEQTTPAAQPRVATQQVLGQAGRRGPLRYGERVQVTDSKGRKHTFVLDPGGYFQSQRGSFYHRDVVGRDEGTVITTESGHELLLLRPLLADYVLSMPRGAQVIYTKDAGQIIAFADIFPGARVLEAGVGSGALTMSLLSAIGEGGHLLSIERRHDFAAIAASNVDAWFGRHHPAWELRTGDFADVVAAHVAEASVDRVVLDMLAPGRTSTPPPARWCPAACSSPMSPRSRSCRAPWRHCASPGASPSPSPGSRRYAIGTSTAWPCVPTTAWSPTPAS